MKTMLTALFVALAFFAGVLEVQNNPHRYPSFTTMGHR